MRNICLQKMVYNLTLPLNKKHSTQASHHWHLGPLLQTTLIPAWISNHMTGKVWDEITYPFLNFKGCTPLTVSTRTMYISLKAEQPTAGCIAIFHKYCGCIKYEGIITNLPLWNYWGYITHMSKCHGAVCGAWIRMYYVLCSKAYSTFGGLFWIPAGLQRDARGTCICETRLLPMHHLV